MSVLASLIAALELTGGERIVLRSGELPHLLVGGARHDLGTAVVSIEALEALAEQILSADGKRAFAEQDVAVEPLSDAVSAIPVLAAARRLGHEICIELRRRLEPQPAADVLTPAEPTPAPRHAPPPVEPLVTPATPAKNVPEPQEASESEPSEWEPKFPSEAGLKIAAVPPSAQPEPFPAADGPTRIVARPEPPPEATAGPVAAGPMKIVAIPEPPPEPTAIPAPKPPEPEPVPLAAGPTKIAVGPECRGYTSALEYWIRRAARRDATALYLRAGQAPVVRVRERVELLAADELDGSLIEGVTAVFAANDDEWRSASDGEWVREYDGVGEVRCQAFTDDLGPGLVVHLSAQHSASTLQKYIPRQVRRACEEDDGIVLVSAAAAADVLAMVAAVAEWTAQRRAGYLISVEPPNGLGHDITGTFVSARRINGPPEDVAAAIRRAAQQRPDILVVALPSGMAVEEAIRAARPGCLMILGVVAPTAPRALESLLSLVDPHVEPQMRRSLAAGLRCGFSYCALRRIGGGRTIVHDVLIATTEVRARLERWDFGALDKLQRSGADGMRSLDAALAGAVQRREISLRQAAAQAADRREVISLIRQASRERVRMSRDRPGVLRAIACGSVTGHSAGTAR